MSFRPRVIRAVAARLIVGVVALAAAVFVGGRLTFAQSAQTRTWDGGGADNNWSTAGNWSADDAPDGTGEAALFTDDPVGQTKLTPNLSADVTIGQLQFSATAPSYTITGTGPSTLFLSPAASYGGVGVTVASGAASQTITAAEVEFLSTQTWDIDGTTTLTVTGTIEDDSVVDYGLTKNGTGTLVFPGDVRYDGATIVNAGSLILSFGNTSMLSALTVNAGTLRATTSANALGNSSTRNTITLSGGALELANNTGLTFGSTSRITTVTGNATIRSDRLTAGAGVTHRLGTLRIGAQTLSVTAGTNATSGTAGTTFGATTLLGNATLNVVNSVGANAQLTLGAVGQSGGTRSLTKTGNGTLRLNGAGSYTGGTTLSQGALTLGVANALGSGGFNFAGGTLNANNTTDSTIGALALTANSTLNLSAGGAAATLTFAGTSGTASGILTITGWSGSPGGLGTNDKIVFSGGTTPSADFLQHIRFDLGDGNTYVGALGAGGELIPIAIPNPTPVLVPDVVGQTQAQASSTLAGVGLVASATTQTSLTIPLGNVIGQNPAAGSSVLTGSTVNIVVSAGVTVPSVVGQTQSSATTTLQTAGLAVTSSTQPSTTVALGSVISQSPAGGTAASGGSTVALVVSSGPPANITLANAQSAQNTASGSFVDLVYTVPNVAGSQLLLVVYGGAEASTTNLALPTGATFHGVSMNVAAQHRTPATGINAGSGLYWLPVSANESGTIRLSFTGTCDERAIGAVTLVGAASTGPEVVETATGTASLTDQITTLSTNAMVISTATQGNSGALTVTGTSHVLDVSAALASSRMAGGHAEVATPSSRTLGYSGTINRIAMILASFPVGALSGPPVTVPNVTNTLQASAQSTLTAAGLQAVITTAYSDTVAAGYVISQNPTAGASVPVGSSVNLLVSLGAQPNVPPSVALTAPADHATGLGVSTMLSASVTDADATTVTFYGRKTAPAVPGPDFVIGALPDTQYYSQNTGGNLAATFYAQTQWYTDSRAALNLAFISHMGDMVQSNDNGSNNSEWNVADTAMRTLEDPVGTGLPYGIPWGGAPGNHDQTTNGQVNAPNAKWNQFFGANRWAGRPYFGGSFSPTNNSNNYELFEASGLEFLIIHLDYTTAAGVNQAVIDWADALMKAYPRRRAIVTSHWILDLPPTSPIGASAPFGGPGQRFFDEFKDNPNLFLMLSGHQHGEGRRTDVFSGRTIYTVLQDYQERANGGNGWLRYFVFSPANNTITAKTYSPTLDQFESDTDATSSPRNQASEFVLPYNMQTAVAPWTVLGTVNVAAGGGSAQFNWTGLEEGSTYEWYVGASDGVTTTTSPVRIFSTADTAAPTVFLTSPANNAMFTTPTDITLTATASDTAGTIAKVEFFADATKLGEDTTSPYSFTWTNAPAGSYSLTARATDDDNATTTSSAVAITVQSLLSVNDATVGEGAGTATFTVTLSAASSQTVTVAYATAPETASTGDYVTTSGTVTFSPGQTTQPIVVPIVNDILVESAETFTVGLSAPTNATISDGTGIGTIQDDDVSVSALSVNDVTVGEGAGTATFTVTLSAASSQTVTVAYATAPGTASTGDYVTTSGTVTFSPGQTTQPVVVPIVNDILVESAETFTVGLSAPTNATIADGTGQATITDDDMAGGTPVTVTVQIAAGGDDVNQDGTALATGVSGVWLGTASSTTSSYAGLRFVNLTVPRNATVTSARLEVNAAATQWQTMAFEYAVEAAGNSAAFATSSLPGSRTLLTPRVTHSSNVQWTVNTWYQLEQIAPLVQALVQRADWASGNALSLILKGSGSAWGRKFAKAYENSPTMAPRLVITYTTP